MEQPQATESPSDARKWVSRIRWEIMGNMGADTSLTTYTNRPVAKAVQQLEQAHGGNTDVAPDNRIRIEHIRYKILNVGADRSMNTYTDEPPDCSNRIGGQQQLVQLK